MINLKPRAIVATIFALALSAVAFSDLSTDPTDPTDDPGTGVAPLTCVGYQGDGTTGCRAKYCSTLAPNWGIQYKATWKCCFKPDGSLDSAKDYQCYHVDLPKGSCCNDLDTGDQHCPQQKCPANKTGIDDPTDPVASPDN